MGDFDRDILVKVNQIIEAASEHDFEKLRQHIEQYSFSECEAVDVRDPKTGFSPLHAAIESCKVRSQSEPSSPEEPIQAEKEDVASEIVQYLLTSGAIWNQLDENNETPGCIAYRLKLDHLYQLLVDAGVRAEILINRLEGYQELNDEEEKHGDGDIESAKALNGRQTAQESAAEDVNANDYLSSSLTRNENRLLDDKSNGVMMAWENGIMLQSADAILYEPGLRVLNIGFGMGIIDSHIQGNKNKPSSHHIIEAHPDVLADMKINGWYDKSGVVIHEGRWQDVLPELVATGQPFDSIYFDTFAESYQQFREFFTEHVIGLLNETGRWSYFNGMGADRQISYDVYQKVVELDLFEAGFDVEWTNVDIPKLDKEWEGVKESIGMSANIGSHFANL